jgi:hypothetical protein
MAGRLGVARLALPSPRAGDEAAVAAGPLDLWLGRRYAMTTMATGRRISLPLDEDLIRRARDRDSGQAT